jgi:hypothetical protein
MHFDPDLIVIFAGITAIVFVVGLFGYLNRKNRQSLIEKLIDKGQPLSPDILAGLANGRHQYTGGIGGAVSLILSGIALSAFLWAMTGYGVPSFLPFVGLFPIAAGLARLIGLIFDKRKDQ